MCCECTAGNIVRMREDSELSCKFRRLKDSMEYQSVFEYYLWSDMPLMQIKSLVDIKPLDMDRLHYGWQSGWVNVLSGVRWVRRETARFKEEESVPNLGLDDIGMVI